MPTDDPTMRNRVLRRHGAVRYPRPKETPNRVHHGPSVVADFAARQLCGEPAAKKRLESFRLVLADLVEVCRTNPVHRAWLSRTLADAVAVCAEPVGDSESPVVAYAEADGDTEPALAQYLTTRCAVSLRHLLQRLRRERAANAELEVHLLREMGGTR